MKTTLPDNYILKHFVQNKYTQFLIINSKNSETFAQILIKELTNNISFVNSVKAPHGYGPMLYDIAMKYCSERGNFLISNNEAGGTYGIYGKTSKDAQNVWDFYEHKRSDVVRCSRGFYMPDVWIEKDHGRILFI